jgi:hydrogenase-1 operon protein HyaF
VSRLAHIPIRFEPARINPTAAVGGLGGGVAAILSELVTLLDRLAERDEAAMIDLRSLPMGPQDRVELQRVLGDGEVQATVNAQGLSNIRETGVPGVWWVEHRDAQGDLVAEMIEVGRVPLILSSASDEIASGALALRERIATAAAPASGENNVTQ